LNELFGFPNATACNDLFYEFRHEQRFPSNCIRVVAPCGHLELDELACDLGVAQSVFTHGFGQALSEFADCLAEIPKARRNVIALVFALFTDEPMDAAKIPFGRPGRGGVLWLFPIGLPNVTQDHATNQLGAPLPDIGGGIAIGVEGELTEGT
jgi:hypothetical protein